MVSQSLPVHPQLVMKTETAGSECTKTMETHGTPGYPSFLWLSQATTRFPSACPHCRGPPLQGPEKIHAAAAAAAAKNAAISEAKTRYKRPAYSTSIKVDAARFFVPVAWPSDRHSGN